MTLRAFARRVFVFYYQHMARFFALLTIFAFAFANAGAFVQNDAAGCEGVQAEAGCCPEAHECPCSIAPVEEKPAAPVAPPVQSHPGLSHDLLLMAATLPVGTVDYRPLCARPQPRVSLPVSSSVRRTVLLCSFLI